MGIRDVLHDKRFQADWYFGNKLPIKEALGKMAGQASVKSLPCHHILCHAICVVPSFSPCPLWVLVLLIPFSGHGLPQASYHSQSPYLGGQTLTSSLCVLRGRHQEAGESDKGSAVEEREIAPPPEDQGSTRTQSDILS